MQKNCTIALCHLYYLGLVQCVARNDLNSTKIIIIKLIGLRP